MPDGSWLCQYHWLGLSLPDDDARVQWEKEWWDKEERELEDTTDKH
jgi:hypothetical protein